MLGRVHRFDAVGRQSGKALRHLPRITRTKFSNHYGDIGLRLADPSDAGFILLSFGRKTTHRSPLRLSHCRLNCVFLLGLKYLNESSHWPTHARAWFFSFLLTSHL